MRREFMVELNVDAEFVVELDARDLAEKAPVELMPAVEKNPLRYPDDEWADDNLYII